MTQAAAHSSIAIAACMAAMFLGFLAALLKFILSPLRLPPNATVEREREQNLLAGILLLFFGGVIGIAVACALLVAAFVRERRIKRTAAGEHPGDRASYLFPAVALQELLGMVLGMAAYPIFVFGTESKRDNAPALFTMIGVGVLLYPFCGLAAYNRVNARRVPVCGARTAYIALFPLMLFACLFQPALLLLFQIYNPGVSPFTPLALGVLATVGETMAGWKCARMASPPGAVAV